MDLSNSNVFYLDVDGVIATPAHIKRVAAKSPSHTCPPGAVQIDPFCLSILKALVNAYNAKIVVSSSWRLFKQDLVDLTNVLAEHGIQIVGQTPYVNGKREVEIKEHMRDNKVNIDNMLVIDDSAEDLTSLENRLLRTDPVNGLKLSDIAKANLIMKNKKTW